MDATTALRASVAFHQRNRRSMGDKPLAFLVRRLSRINGAMQKVRSNAAFRQLELMQFDTEDAIYAALERTTGLSRDMARKMGAML